MSSTTYVTPTGERQYGHCSTAWTSLLARLETTPDDALETTLAEIAESASAMDTFERQNPRDWTQQYRGNPDPRFRVARCVRCEGIKPSIFRSLMADPNIAAIDALEVYETPLGGKAVDALLASTVEGLSLLALEDIGLKPDSVTRLLSWPALDQLRVLSLAYHNKFASASVTALASAPWLADLELLDLTGCADKVSRAAIERLADVPFKRLRSFSMSGGDYITARGRGLPFVHGGAFRQLDRLGLNNMGLGDAELVALAEAPAMRSLKTLHIARNEFTAEGLAEFLGSAPLESLQELVADNYDGTAFDRRVAERLADAPYLPQLTRLELGGGEGRALLANSPRLPAALRPRLA